MQSPGSSLTIGCRPNAPSGSLAPTVNFPGCPPSPCQSTAYSLARRLKERRAREEREKWTDEQWALDVRGRIVRLLAREAERLERDTQRRNGRLDDKARQLIGALDKAGFHYKPGSLPKPKPAEPDHSDMTAPYLAPNLQTPGVHTRPHKTSGTALAHGPYDTVRVAQRKRRAPAVFTHTLAVFGSPARVSPRRQHSVPMPSPHRNATEPPPDESVNTRRNAGGAPPGLSVIRSG